jgi:DsbC/DsbD-like thiol-disulfide interchange protein
MNRRIFITSLISLPFKTPARAAVPWAAKLIVGGFEGKAYQAGLLIDLASGWKTYWRNPGTSGIPPEINVSGENLDHFTTDLPLPERITDESGETLGYHNKVMFILNLTPKDVKKPLDVQLSSFFGVCDMVCTPAKFDAALSFMPNSSPSQDAVLIAEWQNQIPKPSRIISGASVNGNILTLGIKQSVKDIFVEGPENLYFRAPKFNPNGSEATFAIDGLKKPDNLKGQELRITMNAMGMGLEERANVA